MNESELQRAMRVWLPAGACLAGLVVGCVAPLEERKSLGGDRHFLSCPGPLSGCLARVPEVCQDRSYDVVRARDRRYYSGGPPVQSERRSSEAIIQCRGRGTPVGGEQSLLDDDATEPTLESDAESRSRLLCTPGATQACVGVGGCKGGQGCLADGSGFAACECAPAPRAPSPSQAPAAPPTEPAAPPTEPAGPGVSDNPDGASPEGQAPAVDASTPAPPAQ